jgi:tetratricopeptide (TPR) repeat protein
VIKNLIDSVHQHANDHDRLAELSLPTGIIEYWRPRYTLLEHAFRQAPRAASQTAGRRSLPAPPTSAVASRAEDTAVPRQLPAPPSAFVGRIDELDSLERLLDSSTGDGRPAGVVISVVSGTAGIGKTALAVYWAHRARSRFPDGQLYVNLRGFEPVGAVLEPVAALRGFLDALGVPPQRIPIGQDAQAALYRSVLADRRILVMLDNARDAAQVRPLLPGAPGCLVLVTSRNQLSGLIAVEGAHPLWLGLLSTAEARELLHRRIGAGRVAAEPEAVREIIILCARLPLALTIVAARAAIHAQFPLRALAAELGDASGRLGALTADDPHSDLRTVFSWSYQALRPQTARLFRLLGLHPGPDLSAPAAASLTGLALAQVRLSLTELTRANLLTEHTPGRYTFHDLLRAYATYLVHATEPIDQRHAATHRLLDHYLHTAYTANRLLTPARTSITLTPPQPGTIPEEFTDRQQALGWYSAEHTVLLAAVQHAVTTGFDTHTWQLAWTLGPYLDWRGNQHDLVAIGRAAVTAAHRVADPSAQAHTHYLLAGAYIELGRLEDAHIHLQHALDETQTGDLIRQAAIHELLAWVLGRQGRPAEALHHAQQSLDLFQSADYRHGQAYALSAVGWCHAWLGNHHQALTYCHQASTLFIELNNPHGQIATWGGIGYAQYHLGHDTDAITSYHHALRLARDRGDRYLQAWTLTHLGDTHHATGNQHAARDTWQQALTILEELDHPDVGPLRTKLTALDIQQQRLAHPADG